MVICRNRDEGRGTRETDRTGDYDSFDFQRETCFTRRRGDAEERLPRPCFSPSSLVPRPCLSPLVPASMRSYRASPRQRRDDQRVEHRRAAVGAHRDRVVAGSESADLDDSPRAWNVAGKGWIRDDGRLIDGDLIAIECDIRRLQKSSEGRRVEDRNRLTSGGRSRLDADAGDAGRSRGKSEGE